MIKRVLTVVLFVVGVLLLIILAIAAVIGWSLGIGWLLTRIVSFSLFEASLLAMGASTIVLYLAIRILSIRVPADSLSDDLDEAESWDEDDYPIPASRFFQSVSRVTGEQLYRYEMANNIYLELEESPKTAGLMNERQLQELAIRLADISASMFKDKPNYTKRFRATAGALRNQMQRTGQEPYDDDILQLAARVINEQIETDPDLAAVVREKLWNAYRQEG